MVSCYVGGRARMMMMMMMSSKERKKSDIFSVMLIFDLNSYMTVFFYT
jgi:hypothetical protein